MPRGKNSMQRAECDSRLQGCRRRGTQPSSCLCPPPHGTTGGFNDHREAWAMQRPYMDREFSSIHLQTIPGTGTIPSQVRRPVSGPPRRRLVTADNCFLSHPTRGSWLHSTGMQGPSPATCATALPCKREGAPSTTPSSFRCDPIQHCLYPGCPQLRARFRLRAPPASCCVPFKYFFWGLPAPLALS